MPEIPDVVAHVAGEDSSTDFIISIPVDASRPIGLRVVILVDIILLLCIYIFIKVCIFFVPELCLSFPVD